MNQIECPVCGRLEFGERKLCSECGWTIRPTPVEKVYGCDVMIEVRRHRSENGRLLLHFKGSESTARRRALMQRHYLRVLAVHPLDEKTYIQCYGEGRM